MIWRLAFVAGYVLLMAYGGGWREGLLALIGGLLALWVLRVVNMIGDCVEQCIGELVERGERRDRLVRELLARLEDRR
jgi:hypothetical protein